MKTVTTLIFDFGKVITLPPDETQFEIMRGLVASAPGAAAPQAPRDCGLDSFLEAYSSQRSEYDRGVYSPAEYWRRVGASLGRRVEGAVVEELRAADIACWFRFDEAMVARMRALRPRVRTMALLSNINFDGVEALKARADWLGLFDLLVLSCEHEVVKPDRAIYELCLRGLGAEAGECLFVDDTAANVEGARAAGLNAHHYLGGPGLDAELGAGYRLSL